MTRREGESLEAGPCSPLVETLLSQGVPEADIPMWLGKVRDIRRLVAEEQHPCLRVERNPGEPLVITHEHDYQATPGGDQACTRCSDVMPGPNTEIITLDEAKARGLVCEKGEQA